MNARRTLLLGIVLALLAAGCGGPKTNAKKVYTREEFRKEFLGAALNQVRDKLGAPDKVEIGIESLTPTPDNHWVYKGRTKGKKGVIDPEVWLRYKDDRIDQITPEPD